MTTPPADQRDSLPTSTCRACGRQVPAGTFCGECGTGLPGQRGRRVGALRAMAHAAAPDQHALRPSLITSLFPRLPRRSRPAFGAGVITLGILVAVLVLVRWQPPLIGVCALGMPLLFVVYLYETAAFEEIPVAMVATTAALGTAFGIGWAIVTDAIWAQTYDDVLATPMTTAQQVINLIIVPTGGVALMLLPVVVVRFWRPGGRESLQGFVIGVVAVLCFTSSGVLTRAASQFSDGLVVDNFPMDALVALAAIRGVAGPITAVAVGGVVGVAFWFRRRPDAQSGRHWYSVTSPLPAVALAVLFYGGQNAIDFAWISYVQIVGLYALTTFLALLAVRMAVHLGLLGEESEETSPSEPVLCPQCDHVVPDRAFCVNCGVAATAASRSSRRHRRSQRPVPSDASQGGR